METRIAGLGVWMQERRSGTDVAVWVQGRRSSAVVSAIGLEWPDAMRHARRVVVDTVARQMGLSRASLESMVPGGQRAVPVLRGDASLVLEWPFVTVGRYDDVLDAYLALTIQSSLGER